MRMASGFLGLVAAVLLSASVSQAATFSLVGTGDISKPDDSTSTDSLGSKVGFGGGALLDFGVAQWTSLEIGALYINRKEDDTTLGAIDSTHAIQVPVLLRWWLEPMFSIAVGGYYSQSIGSVNEQDSSGNSLGSESFSDAGLKTSDFGLTGSVAVRLPITQSMRLLIDGRYNYGLTNISTDPNGVGETIKNRDIQALVGFQFAMHSNR